VTVEELIARLREFPTDLVVELLHDDGVSTKFCDTVYTEDDRSGKTTVVLASGWEGL